MANFSDGVSRFIKAQATVTVFFPVDWRGSEELACKHCEFFLKNSSRCGLTHRIVNFPEKFVGTECPLEIVEEEKE